MRHIIDRHEVNVLGTKLITHLLCWEDIAEQTRAVQAAARLGRLGHLSDPFLKLDSVGEKREWLGRADLRTWDDVVRAVEAPWKRGMRSLDRLSEQLAQYQFAAPRSIKRRGEWSADTGDFDYDRYMSGQDSFRGVARRDVTGQQFVTLMVQIGGNCNVAADRIMWRGVAAVAITRILEEQGYGVEIIAFDAGLDTLQANPEAGARRPQNLINAVWIKRPDQLLDAPALVNAISPWFFRLCNFASYGLVPGEKVTAGLGSEVRLDKRFVALLTGDERFVLIEEVWSMQTAIALANKVLRQFAEPGTEDEPDAPAPEEDYTASHAEVEADGDE